MMREIDRLQNLSAFALDYGEYHDRFQPFIELAKTITNSPVCEINIIDAYNQWTIARTEEDLKVIPREESVCFDTIQQQGPYEISDLQQEDRYKNRDYVTGDPYFRYYCGVQLTTKEGENIGSICVLDQETKEISDHTKGQLEYLADLVVQNLEKDRQIYNAKRKVHKLRERFRTFNHDLRNPINGVIGIISLYDIEDGEEVPVAGKDLKIIKDCAKAIASEIDDVMESSGGDTDLMDITDMVTLDVVFERVENLTLPQAKNKGIAITVEKLPEGDMQISMYSAKRLIQILSNLVANAIKFTKSDGAVRVLPGIVHDEENKYLEIEVRDTGIGMMTDQVERFNSGRKVAGKTGTKGEASFGIGLQHVRNLVADLNGTITARSEPDEGTIFTMRFEVEKL